MSVADPSTSSPDLSPGLPAWAVAVDVRALTEGVRSLLPQLRADLERLVAIPSVSAPAFGAEPVDSSARAVAELLRGAGLTQVDILRVTDPATGAPGRPAVVAHRPGPPGSCRVLLYAHHDVQPPGPVEQWTSPPFEATEREGRLYGRGAADDKAGICLHLAALRALGEGLGVSITVFVEGEEEIGSPTFETFLAEHRDRLAADVIVVADSGNWRLGVPTLTTSLRGLVDGVVEVRTLDHALHSGMFGGAVPDATTVLLRMLATLWDDEGNVAVHGLRSAQGEELDYPEQDLRTDAGVLDGVELIGTGSLASRLWTRPALTVIGIDSPPIATSSNTLQPKARAKFSLRVAPGQDGATAFEAVAAHLRRVAPWGARVEVTVGEIGRPWAGDVRGEVYDVARWALSAAWDRPTVHMGVGGSIPFIAALQQVYPDAAVLVTGVEDPDTRAHGIDESLHLGEFARACVAETLLLAALAGQTGQLGQARSAG